LQAQAGLTNFDERHYAVSASVGRRFGIHHTVWITGGYEVVEIPDYLPGRTISPNGKDSYPIGSVGYVYDTRDLAEYPTMGSFVRLAVTKSGIPGNDLDIVRYAIDLRRYTPIGSLFTWSIRGFSDLVAAGETPSYYHTYLGYSERIRGHFKEVREGENLLGVSSELHFVLLPVRYFNVDFLPPEFGIWKFGVVATAFADAGTVWFRGSSLAI
jgi:outer membrane protein assembly factor BamA